MLDILMGYLYNLINAGDNEGRISWTPSGQNDRMLDDIRLLTYPSMSNSQVAPEVIVTVDCALPYEEDLAENPDQTLTGTDNVTNEGNRPVYPVFKIYSGNFTLANSTTGYQFVFNQGNPGCPDVGPGEYVEINTLRNTVYLNGDEDNMKPGIVVESSDFFTLPPGVNTITLDDGLGTSQIIFNNAWA
jgi:phage-related protein